MMCLCCLTSQLVMKVSRIEMMSKGNRERESSQRSKWNILSPPYVQAKTFRMQSALGSRTLLLNVTSSGTALDGNVNKLDDWAGAEDCGWLQLYHYITWLCWICWHVEKNVKYTYADSDTYMCLFHVQDFMWFCFFSSFLVCFTLTNSHLWMTLSQHLKKPSSFPIFPHYFPEATQIL